MDKHTEAVHSNWGTLLGNKRILLMPPVDGPDQRMVNLRAGLAAALRTGKTIYARVRENVIERANSARERLFEVVLGIILGLGALIGFLSGPN